MICKLILPDCDGHELCVDLFGHLPGDFTFVIFGSVKSKSESANRSGVVTRSQAQDSTRVNPAAQVTPNWNISTEANAHRLIQSVAEFLRVFLIRSLWPKF